MKAATASADRGRGYLDAVTAEAQGTEAPQSDRDRILKLAALPAMEYDRQRTEAASSLGVQVATLDREVKQARADMNTWSDAAESIFPEIMPWPDMVNGAELLDAMASAISRFVIMPKHAANALALWILFSHCIDCMKVAPILAANSPEKRCGKSTLMGLLVALCYRPLPASNITPAALFRAIEKWAPTLLIDEADSFLRSSDELRGILNSGHTRGTAFVIRTVGDDFEPKRFSTWGAKAIAMIGTLPDTLADRSINIEMRRKLPSEQCEKLRHADPQIFQDLAAMARRFATDNEVILTTTKPAIPDALNDRAGDSWEPLLAIADIAGGDWPEKARAAALALSGQPDADGSLKVQLLGDIRAIFASRGMDKIHSADLVDALVSIEDRPWSDYRRGRAITQRQLAGLLRGFGIVSTARRIGETNLKGYALDDFEDAFRRYLPRDPKQRHNVVGATVSADSASETEGACNGSKNQPEAAPDKGCDVVTDLKTPADKEVF